MKKLARSRRRQCSARRNGRPQQLQQTDNSRESKDCKFVQSEFGVVAIFIPVTSCSFHPRILFILFFKRFELIDGPFCGKIKIFIKSSPIQLIRHHGNRGGDYGPENGL